MRRRFAFKSKAEALAFIAGVEYVNDSALRVGKPVRGKNGWAVTVTDTDQGR